MKVVSLLMFCAAGLVVGPASFAAQPTSPSQTIPTDTDVTVGTLPNGLRFYVRVNHKPEHRAELRLVVNAGSVLEDSAQRGLAHFVEYMAFSGTRHFARQELVN